ncbi:acyl-homoserine-lactone synthase [Methylobacter tundripaludum]|uniref:acyl-homoserine-lactone synthase n=1 Tax=Methylobacter tundripaludum TaxID=173365 RepID=UPI001C2807E0
MLRIPKRCEIPSIQQLIWNVNTYVVKGRQEDLPDELYSQAANYRHKIFGERLGWQLQTFNYAEQDQFDRFNTVYVISRGEQGNISECARLLTSTQPHLP